MGWMMATALFLQISVQMGTPLLFGTLGGILGEKTGNLNLGVEGMMIMGAAVGFKTALVTASPWLAVLAAGLAGALGALIYSIITVTLKGNQTVTGLALTIFGTGFAGMLGKSMSGVSLPASVMNTFAAYDVPGLCNIPIIGKALFSQSIYVQIAPVLAILIYFFIKKTQIGLNMRAVGENPAAADASGINVTRYKYVSLLLGGFLCGVGGAYLSLVFVPSWQDNITNGLGWIAVALVIFSTWNPAKAIFGAYLFGAFRGMGYKLQNTVISLFGMKITFSSQLLDMVPYVATIVVLVIITMRKKKENQPPAWLSRSYFREER
ncbi:MAG: ABC transporter permease [Christensenellales bacterium]|jgi:ABC-type uncharacterized transport system permease subunit